MQNVADYAEKKVKILIFDFFLEFECLNMLDTADYDSTNDCGEGGDHEFFHSIFRSRKRAARNLPPMTKMETMMGKGGG